MASAYERLRFRRTNDDYAEARSHKEGSNLKLHYLFGAAICFHPRRQSIQPSKKLWRVERLIQEPHLVQRNFFRKDFYVLQD